MFRARRVVFLYVAALALTACSPAPRFLFYLDPYSAELLEARGLGRSAIQKIFPEGIEPRLEIASTAKLSDPDRNGRSPSAQPGSADSESFERLAESIARLRPRWVYLSAAHSFTGSRLASSFPDTLFIRDGFTGGPAWGTTEGPNNQLRVVYQWELAFREAGEALGRLVALPRFQERIGEPVQDIRPLRVGILVAESNDRVESEIDEFRAGFIRFADPDLLDRKDVGSLTDRVNARRLLDRMKEEGTAVFLLKTYTLTGFCLEYLQKEGGAAIVDSELAYRAYPEAVLLVLEEDFQQAIRNVLEHTVSSSGSRSSAETVVTAPVRLIWSGSYASLVGELLGNEEPN